MTEKSSLSFVNKHREDREVVQNSHHFVPGGALGIGEHLFDLVLDLRASSRL